MCKTVSDQLNLKCFDEHIFVAEHLLPAMSGRDMYIEFHLKAEIHLLSRDDALVFRG